MKKEIWNYGNNKIEIIVEVNDELKDLDELEKEEKERELEKTIDLREVIKEVGDSDAKKS